MSKSNLFIGEDSSSVTSPVVSLAVDSCDSSKRRRRRSAGVALGAGASTDVNINIDRPSPGIAVNETPSADSDGIMISLFNLTSPGKMPILIRIVPEDPAEVNVFVRLNSTPTSTEYDWFLTSGFNGTNNYTMYISAEQTVEVNYLFIGVQSPTGIFIIHSPEGSTSEHNTN